MFIVNALLLIEWLKIFLNTPGFKKGFVWASLIFWALGSYTYAQSISAVTTFADAQIDDQDDMCVWVHPDPSQSLIITSDKAVNKLFVYDLSGNTLQRIAVSGKPGNIDVRYNFPLNGQKVDIVAYNDRDATEIVIYSVDAASRQLQFLGRIDAGGWPGELYGFCLYHSIATGKYYAFGAGTGGQLRQWELVDDGSGGITGIERRTWDNFSQTEGLVADDENGWLFAANEVRGVYRYDAEPTNNNPTGLLIAKTGENGLVEDVEGITIYYAANGEGYLLVSSQGNDKFNVYERKPPHAFVKQFSVSGAGSTDGIDVANLNFGSRFPDGLFVLHNGNGSIHPVLGCDYADLGLAIDTDYWNPRQTTPSAVGEQPLIPEAATLHQNYPNPFNPSTVIGYQLQRAGEVKLSIYNLLGQEVATLVNGYQAAGSHEVSWDALRPNGDALPGGIYFAQLQAEGVVHTIKMTLIK
jgi:3-phytase